MASSPSSSSSPVSKKQLTQQEFFSFYNIDRQLFFRLAIHLRRDPSEVMQAIAFWLWLERIHKSSCIGTILKYHDPIVEVIFEETLMALRVAEGEEYHSSNDAKSISNLQNIVGNDRVSLQYFHDNRIVVLLGVGNIIQQVCLRAFQDLIELIPEYRALPPNLYQQYGNYPHGNMNPTGNNGNVRQELHAYPPSFNPSLMPGNFSAPLQNPFQIEGGLRKSNNVSSSKNINISSDYIPLMVQDNLAELFSQIQMSEDHQSQENSIPPGERTIFLTFSKGYPISELELRDFLYRSFGDIIETLYMQDVENEQPLYARLVVRDAISMDIVLSGQGKVKFAINGKHVWARKFVRKNPNSPPSSPTTGSN